MFKMRLAFNAVVICSCGLKQLCTAVKKTVYISNILKYKASLGLNAYALLYVP